MKAFTSLSIAAALGLIGNIGYGALSIVADADTPFGIASGTAAWDTITFPPSGLANVYWDANGNGTFGEVGENSGNDNATLPFSIGPIASGVSYLFALEGFPVAEATGEATFTITKSDATTEFLTVVQGVPTAFADSTGEIWAADFVFNNGGYGDVVFNGGAPGNGAFTPDHQGILTFSQIPEPSSVMLSVLGGLAFLARRRR